MTKMKFNENWIKFVFKKIIFQSYNSNFPIVIKDNLSVIESQFGFPDTKFIVWRFIFYLSQIEDIYLESSCKYIFQSGLGNASQLLGEIKNLQVKILKDKLK